MAKKFAGFTTEQMKVLLPKVGYTGSSMQADEVNAFLASNPAAAAKMGKYTLAARRAIEGAPVKMAAGGYATYQAALDKAQAAVAEKRTALANANNKLAANPENASLKTAVDNAQLALTQAEATLQTAQQNLASAGTPTGAELTAAATNNPSSLVETADVATISDADKKEGTIATGTGQLTGEAPVVTASTVGETAQVSEPIEKAAVNVEAATVSQDITDVLKDAKAVTGTYTEGEAAQGKVSDGALATAMGVDEKFIQQVKAGTLEVTPEQLAQVAEALNIPVSEAQTMLAPTDVEAAKFGTPTPVAEAQDDYTLTPTQIATQAVTSVSDAAKASEIPTTEAAKTEYQSILEAAQGSVGANELVQAKDIVATAQAVEAIAAIAEGLDAAAVATAAQGTFSQASLAKVEQGTVSAEATMQGQMSKLMEQFNNGTPAWAAGAMRAANAAMAARGLGGSSIAAAAIVQAAMESAMPIAQQDAQVFAQMNMANLSNRHQVSLANAAAQQNLELANLNNRQQTALQNSANAFALQSQNLSNQQAVVLANAQFKASLQEKVLDVNTQVSLANAAKYAEMNKLNLTNRQQAALQKSSEELQIDMTNLTNEQQTAIANLQVRAAMLGQELSNEQQMAMLESTQSFERAQFDASSKQQAFLQDASARAALEGKALDARQQTALFNVSSVLEERNIELTNEQQTRIYNSTNRTQVDLANLSNKQQTALANAQIEAALRGQELSNKQEVAIVNATRYAEAAGISFNAEQQAQLTNSQLMQSIGLAELNTRQATALQNAATIAAMDTANLNNRQQMAVENARNFLQMDLANMTNEQQMAMFTKQETINAMLSDQAAVNAANQFNASSENQTNQFFASLTSQINQFNASQMNAMNQFNAGEINSINQFNAQLQNQRDQFNANNQLVVSQANAKWFQDITTTENAAQNQANRDAAMATNNMTMNAYNNIVQQERDLMAWAWQSSENAIQRDHDLAINKINNDAAGSSALAGAAGSLISSIVSNYTSYIWPTNRD